MSTIKSSCTSFRFYLSSKYANGGPTARSRHLSMLPEKARRLHLMCQNDGSRLGIMTLILGVPLH